MLFDTDVLIWALRGNRKASGRIDGAPSLHVSAVSYMERLMEARDKREQKAIQAFLRDLGFEQLPVTSTISHRAVIESDASAGQITQCPSWSASTPVPWRVKLTMENLFWFLCVTFSVLIVFVFVILLLHIVGSYYVNR